MSGHFKRSIGVAMVFGGGNIGGIIASNIFITTEAPYYHTGISTCLGLLVMCGTMATVLAVAITLENKKRDRGGRDYRYEDVSELDNLGDNHPSFRYSL